MNRFVAVLMLAGGLLVAGGAIAADIPTSGILSCLANTTVSAQGVPGDPLIIQNVFSCANFVATSNNPAVTGGPVTINQGSMPGLTISPTANPGLYASVITITDGNTTVLVDLTITGAAPAPAAVPTLSEWSQMLLALMTIMLVGWHFHKQRSY